MSLLKASTTYPRLACFPAHLKGCTVMKLPRQPHWNVLLLTKNPSDPRQNIISLYLCCISKHHFSPASAWQKQVLYPELSFISSSSFTTAKPGFSAAISPKPRNNHQNTLWVIHRFCCQKASDLPHFLNFTACQAACSHCFVFNPGFTNIPRVKCDIFLTSSKSVKFRIEQTLDVLVLFVSSILRRETKAIQTCRLKIRV